MTRRITILLAILALTTLVAGCRTAERTDGSAIDQKPWNAPAAWEGMIWGVPY